jgi:hypothetical protein
MKDSIKGGLLTLGAALLLSPKVFAADALPLTVG